MNSPTTYPPSAVPVGYAPFNRRLAFDITSARPLALLLDAALDACRDAGASRRHPRRHATYFRIALPYVLAPVDAGRLIVCNRRYKPLGLTSTFWVDYTIFSEWHLPASIGTAAAGAWTAAHDGHLWLFDDASMPWRGIRQLREYTERLTCLIDALRSSGVGR
jgi:hypothetical protein